MTVIEPGHMFELFLLDAEPGARHLLSFVKRIGEKYPMNDRISAEGFPRLLGQPHQGTNLQDGWRAEIARLKYLDSQESCFENGVIIENLRQNIWLLELRAARRHGRILKRIGWHGIELANFCTLCGHIECEGQCRSDT